MAVAPAGNLDGDLGLRPQAHMFVGLEGRWYTITDSLPQHAQPAARARRRVSAWSGRPSRNARASPTGSCLCGAVAFEYRAPLRMYQCHCSRCRRARSAAHGANVFVKLDDFQVHARRGARMRSSSRPRRSGSRTPSARCGGKAPAVQRAPRRRRRARGARSTRDPLMRPQANIFVASKAVVVRHHRRLHAVRGAAAALAR